MQIDKTIEIKCDKPMFFETLTNHLLKHSFALYTWLNMNEKSIPTKIAWVIPNAENTIRKKAIIAPAWYSGGEYFPNCIEKTDNIWKINISGMNIAIFWPVKRHRIGIAKTGSLRRYCANTLESMLITDAMRIITYWFVCHPPY